MHIAIMRRCFAAFAPLLCIGCLSAADFPVVFSELKVNPPGTNDAPNEFIELTGPPSFALSNISILCLAGDEARNPGTVVWKADLDGVQLGVNGMLLVVAPSHPYAVPPECRVFPDLSMGAPGGALPNGSLSFLLVSNASAVNLGDDLDRGDNGIPEGLPQGALVLDSVAWDDGDHGDVVYGGAVLRLQDATPDAATRLPWDHTPRSASAWICGDLEGQSGETLAYDETVVSARFPLGTLLSPGAPNNIAPTATGLAPISGVIGDPWNPQLLFNVNDDQTAAEAIQVTASSNDQGVVPDTNLTITAGSAGERTLSLSPVGVGYATITLRLSDGTQTGRVSVAYAASAPGRPGGIWHAGASDASTAIPIDTQYMVVGDDENQVLRIYERQRSGYPLAQFDMTASLGLPDIQSGLPREVDVEASTRVGNRLFWMGSLGHAVLGESRTNRTRVFATDLSGSGASAQLTFAGRYDYMKVDLIAWDMLNLHGKGTNYYGLEASDAEGVPPKAPDGSGFAVEGLAMMPGSTNGAFIGFRAPIVPPTNRTHALIVPVLNFAALAASGGPLGSAAFGPPIELDLYNRGIRSIEGGTNGYLIVAGPPGAGTGAYPADFRLYSWTGSRSDPALQRTANLRGLNPEGIVGVPPPPWTADTPVQLLSDEGATVFYGDGIQAKFLPVQNFKKARSDRVTIGPAEKPIPLIVSASVADNFFIIRWRSLKGETYQVQKCQDLVLPSWQDLPGLVSASGPYSIKPIPIEGTPAFFRVVLLP